jgi:DNA-binding HxlR family transcriptional regulator
MIVLGVIGNRGNGKNFNEILKDIHYSSSRIISKRLKEPQNFQLIQRHKGAEGVTYTLSGFGHNVRESLLPLLHMVEKTSTD